VQPPASPPGLLPIRRTFCIPQVFNFRRGHVARSSSISLIPGQSINDFSIDGWTFHIHFRFGIVKRYCIPDFERDTAVWASILIGLKENELISLHAPRVEGGSDSSDKVDLRSFKIFPGASFLHQMESC
jgi:hypothetical protein